MKKTTKEVKNSISIIFREVIIYNELITLSNEMFCHFTLVETPCDKRRAGFIL